MPPPAAACSRRPELCANRNCMHSPFASARAENGPKRFGLVLDVLGMGVRGPGAECVVVAESKSSRRLFDFLSWRLVFLTRDYAAPVGNGAGAVLVGPQDGWYLLQVRPSGDGCSSARGWICRPPLSLSRPRECRAEMGRWDRENYQVIQKSAAPPSSSACRTSARAKYGCNVPTYVLVLRAALVQYITYPYQTVTRNGGLATSRTNAQTPRVQGRTEPAGRTPVSRGNAGGPFGA